MLRQVLGKIGLAALSLSLTLCVAMPILSQGTQSPQANSNATPGTQSNTTGAAEQRRRESTPIPGPDWSTARLPRDDE